MNVLEGIKSRLAAATPGPWAVDELGDVETIPEFDLHRFDIMPETIARTELRKEDGEFIAHAPEDIARLVRALESVIELADNYEMTAGMIQHALSDKALLAAASRDIHNTIAAALEARP